MRIPPLIFTYNAKILWGEKLSSGTEFIGADVWSEP